MERDEVIGRYEKKRVVRGDVENVIPALFHHRAAVKSVPSAAYIKYKEEASSKVQDKPCTASRK